MDEITLNAVKHFGGLEAAPLVSLVYDKKQMSHSGGEIKIGTLTIPKNSNPPKRIIIDTDPNYPYVLVRIIGKGCISDNH